MQRMLRPMFSENSGRPRSQPPTFGRVRADFGPTSGRNRSKSGRIGPKWADTRPASAQTGSELANFGPISADVGQIWPHSARNSCFVLGVGATYPTARPRCLGPSLEHNSARPLLSARAECIASILFDSPGGGGHGEERPQAVRASHCVVIAVRAQIACARFRRWRSCSASF